MREGKGVVVAVVVVVVLVCITAGGAFVLVRSGSGRECTLAGCAGQASVAKESIDQEVLARAATVTLCVDGRCTSSPPEPASSTRLIRVELVSDRVEQASLEVVDADGETIAIFDLAEPADAEVFRPNGPDCQPACPTLTLGVADGRLAKVPV